MKTTRIINGSEIKGTLSLLNVITFTIACTIGAGIFLKSQNNVNYAWGSTLILMISRIIGVLIIICIAASLKETCSGVNKNNGVISWVRTYCPIKIYELAKSFFAFIYIPISLIGLSFLCVSVFQQSFSIKLPAIAVIGISALLLTYFLITNLSLRLINITSDFTLIIKFFPLVVFFVIGFITAIFHGGSYHPLLPPDTNPNTTTPLTSQILPITGVFAILPAVFFCFDGFYAASTLTRHMKEPHKNSKAILIGLLIACVFDLGITLSLCIGSKTGSSSGFVEIFNSWGCGWIINIMQLFIVFSIFGVMNGRCKMGVTIFNDLIENNEIMFSKKMNNYSFKENTKGIIYMVPLLFVFFLLYTLCGYFYSDTDLYNQNYNYISTTSGKIYSFAGVTTSWTGIFSFILIALAFLGTIKNRKTNKIKNTKDKYFLIYSWISVVSIFFIALVYFLFNFCDIGFVIYYCVKNKYATPGIRNDNILSIVVKNLLLILIIVSTILLAKINNKKKQNNFNNINANV